jgi:hypothetical protein
MSDSILHYRRTAESMADFMLTNGPPPRALSHGKQLKLKQQQFCEYFVHHGNAARAVREAGYSEKNASYQGCRLLRDSRVRAYVHELRQKYALETQWEMEDTLDHLAIIYDCAMTDKNYNAAGRLNTMAVKTLEQAPVPEEGALMMETNTIRRYTRPSPNRDDFLEDMSPETLIGAKDDPIR